MRCGHCGNACQALCKPNSALYRCNPASRLRYDCPHFTMTARELDAAVWGFARRLLTRPDFLRREVERLRTDDPTVADRQAVAGRLTTVERRRTNLAETIGATDDPDTRGLILAQLTTLNAEKRDLEVEAARLAAEQAQWAEAQTWLDDLDGQFQRLAHDLDALTYEQKRDRLRLLGITVELYPTTHVPRWIIRCRLSGAEAGIPTAVGEVIPRVMFELTPGRRAGAGRSKESPTRTCS